MPLCGCTFTLFGVPYRGGFVFLTLSCIRCHATVGVAGGLGVVDGTPTIVPPHPMNNTSFCGPSLVDLRLRGDTVGIVSP